MRYSKGDILVCSADELYGQKYQLVVGDKYQILDIIEMSEDKTILQALHIKSNRNIGLVSDRLIDQVSWEEENEGELKTIYKNGEFVKETNYSEIRERVKSRI